MPDERLIELADERKHEYAGLTYANFKLTARLTSPIAATLPWISLDGLLAWAMLLDLLGEEAWNHQGTSAEDLVDLPVPIEERGELGLRYFAASFGLYLAAESVNRFKKRWDEQHDHLVDFRGRREKIQTDGLFFKAKDMPCVIRDAREVSWYVHGNAAECERLMREHITHAGKLRGHGYGRIRSIEITPMDEDYSCWYKGMPMRAIPEEYIEFHEIWAYRTEYCGYRPPYWAPHNQTMCLVP